VLRDESVLALEQAEGVLLFRPAREDVHVALEGSAKRERGEATRAAEELGSHSRGGAQHRVVVARVDVAIVHQEGVRDVAEAGQRLPVAGGDGLVTPVP
jgi:hypothetical protein